MSYTKQITRDKLYDVYPDIASILDDIYESNRQSNYWFFVNYLGKYKDKNGKPRAVSMGAVMDILEQHGYDIQIVATKKFANQTIIIN